MNSPIYPEDWPDLDKALYLRSIKLFSAVKNLLSVKLELYADTKVLQGDIFLFNHFSRFETFIPQFLIYENTGTFSCAIASGEFFKEKNMLSNYLQHVGVYPHDHPRLFAMLAGQILRGRKVIIFPEGGMIKDHRVIDKTGEYNIYSRMTGHRRKLHTGAAVLGQGVEAIKVAIRHAFDEGRLERLLHWQEQLQFDNLNELLAAAHKPTVIVPANITFYPIRASENLLFKSVEQISGGLSLRQSEELLIESNILLKDTDMDIRMGKPVNPCCVWDWRTHFIMNKVAPDIEKLDHVFKLKTDAKNWKERLLEHYFIKNAQCARDQYMKEIYANLTVNISHLASTLIMSLIGAKRRQIDKCRFYLVLYVAIKHLQKNTDIHLHSSLLNPDDYGGLPHGVSTRFEQFICFAKQAELIAERDGCYHFLPKLCEDYDFDRIRLENPIAVYNNEAAPLRTVLEALLASDAESRGIDPYRLAAWHFEDEQLSLAYERQTYADHSNGNMKHQETATADPSPFFIQPSEPNGFGILLIHGLLASPAELREYGRYLADQGYTVLGIRLKGHGTSPYALRDASLEQWFGSVQKGFNILKVYCSKLFVIGFSTGGALALKLAAEKPAEMIGLVCISVSIKFVNPAFMLVPLLYNANALVRWVSSFEGVKPFIEHAPEHPDINYWNMPVRALYELRRLIHQLESLLPSIATPTLVMYADQDPVVSPQSAEIVFNKLGTTHKELHPIKSAKHGILTENIGNSWAVIDGFLSQYRHNHVDEAITPRF
ncbi:alpha/beta fold hydrolase [Methylomicrobium lacus]|uniref:alpha/beta fold hydrolase n=1 Tax=Methylomicrobium lacus TaxID=136992 RepID=UPI00045E6436|nr:alpha/beta fold hydrolase [Methylomicrobium lacus]